jgi:hypothetical protein
LSKKKNAKPVFVSKPTCFSRTDSPDFLKKNTTLSGG